MNSGMVKPEKFGHLYLVYHFTVPLKNGEVSEIQLSNFDGSPGGSSFEL